MRERDAAVAPPKRKKKKKEKREGMRRSRSMACSLFGWSNNE
jgi:hypothetical protein